MAKKKILFAMIEAGGGHKMPALAVYESLQTLFPGKYSLKIMDLMKDLGCTDMDSKHKALWKYLLSHPLLTKSFQTLDFITGPVNIQIYKKYLTPFYEPILDYLTVEKPDLIFSTHYFNTMAISHVRKTYNVNPILLNYLTEIFDFDSYWHLKNVDYYIVASETAQKKLLKKKFPEDRLFVFPYPVRNSFFNLSREKDDIARSLKIDIEKKTLLITLGGEGIGSIDKMIAALEEKDFPLNVIVVTGNNSELKKKIEENHQGSENLNFFALGFVDNLNELISISDFCFIKPGPATTWEVLLYKKPIIFYGSAQLSENPNIKYVCRNNLGIYAGINPKKFIRAVAEMMDDSVLAGYKTAYEEVTIHNGADDIARFIDSILDIRK